jgi:glycosyltransferase involved in cell wall biosynthesis
MLQVAGRGPSAYELSLRRLVARYGIEGHVEFLGFLSGDDRWSALAAAELFVLTSYSESFCIAALEAMTVGTPVLLSETIAVSDSVRAAGAGLITDCSIEGTRCALERFLADSDLRDKLAQNAFQYASHADSLQSVAEQVLNVYAKAI